MRLPLYRKMTLNALRSNMADRMELLLFLFGQLMSLLIQVYIWYALYGQNVQMSLNVGSVSIREMITYVIISNIPDSFRSISKAKQSRVWVCLLCGFCRLYAVSYCEFSGHLANARPLQQYPWLEHV